MDRKSFISIALAAAIALAASIVAQSSGLHAIAAEKEATSKATFLDRLKPGQPVAVEEKNGHYYISIFPKTFRPLSHKVVEVGMDFVTVRDLAQINDTIIPVYSVASIRILRTGE
jgi:hypothetical protein